MPTMHRTIFATAVLLSGIPAACSANEDLLACFDAVGTLLTTNLNPTNSREVGRSLISLTNGGHFFLTDSNEGGEARFAPFAAGRGIWRCVSDEAGSGTSWRRARLHPQTADFTEQRIARLD
jgi:hypothetical protein